MYVSRADSAIGVDEWREFVVKHNFGQLVAAGRHRDVPVVSPIQFVLDGDRVLTHLAATNLILEAIGEQPRVVTCVAGDWAFIPSRWRAIGDEDPRAAIPTTYYAAVEREGTATILSDPAGIAEALQRQGAGPTAGSRGGGPASGSWGPAEDDSRARRWHRTRHGEVQVRRQSRHRSQRRDHRPP